jgi:hypothetical protein
MERRSQGQMLAASPNCHEEMCNKVVSMTVYLQIWLN